MDEKIVECVDGGLESLGESVKHAIYYYVEENFQLKKSQIPREPEVLDKAMVSLFGEEGASIIKELIVRRMRKAFQLKGKSKQTFADFVEQIRVAGHSNQEMQTKDDHPP